MSFCGKLKQNWSTLEAEKEDDFVFPVSSQVLTSPLKFYLT